MSGKSIAIVGAAGRQASTIIGLLARAPDPPKVLAFDRAWSGESEARAMAHGAEVLTLDVRASRDRFLEQCRGIDLLANCAGPFYVLDTAMLEAAIELGTDYLDICDDIDVTERLLALDGKARAARTRALLGMGSSPGTTNVLVRLALDALPEGADSGVELFWSVDSQDMTPAAFQHLLHCFGTALPGRPGTPNWPALEPQAVRFPEPVGEAEVVILGHPEPLSIPRFTGAATVNKGGVTPVEHLHLCWALARAREGGENNERGVPAELYDIYKRFDAVMGARRRRQGSGLRIDVTAGERGYRFESGSTMEMNYATAVPSAAGIALMLDDPGLEPGVWAPECLKPARFFEALRHFSSGGGSLHVWRLEGGEPTEQLRIRDLL